MLTDLDFPSSRRRSGSRQPMVIPLGINNEGTIVGMQVKPGNLKTRPFIYEDGVFRSIGPFRKGLNYIGGINDAGNMAGWYRDGGASHDFVATPVPIPGSVWLLGAGLLSLPFTLRRGLRRGSRSSAPSPDSSERSS